VTTAKHNCRPLVIPLHGASTRQISVRHSYAGVSSNLTVVGSRLCCQNLGHLFLRRSENYLKIIFTNRTKKTLCQNTLNQ
jgi:hypothetical protein